MRRICCCAVPVAYLLSCMLLAAAWSSQASAQLPTAQLTAVFPAGAVPDTTIDFRIEGSNLDETDQIVFSHDGITAKQKMNEATPFDEGPQPIENEFSVTVGANVPPGNYQVRSRGKYGLSNPRTFVVGTIPESTEVEPNGGNEFPEWSEVDDSQNPASRQNPATEIVIPTTVNGQSTDGADVDWFRFRGTSGQRVLLDGFAKRIDSQMDLMITLYADDGGLIGGSRKVACGDPLIDATLPADGDYFVKVHDVLYRSGREYHYRLQISSQPHLDFIFPPAGLPGTTQQYTVYGSNLPGGEITEWTVDGAALEKTTVEITLPENMENRLEFSSVLEPHQGDIDGIEYRMENESGKSNPLLVTVATAPIVLEQPNNDRAETAQMLVPPCEVAGQFFPQRDLDWYSFEAKKDEVWIVEVISQRLGISTDPSLLIQRVSTTDKGETQVRDIQFVDDVADPINNNNRASRHEFDIRTSDPYYVFTAPDDGTYRILVKDGFSSVKSDPRLTYRLAIRKPKPDFRVVAVPTLSSGSFLLRHGGRQTVRVFAFRQDGYDGEITVACSGLPQGVTCDPITIGPGNSTGSLVLTAAPDAPPAISLLTVTATGRVSEKELVRTARYGTALETFQFAQANSNIPSVRSRIVDRIQLCVTDYDPAPKKLTIGEGKVLETSRGGRLNIPYQVEMVEGAKGNLNAVAVDLPPQTTVGQINIGDKKEGEFEIRFQSTTPPGTYTFYVDGFNQGHSYIRNPEQAEHAKQRQDRIAKILADAQQAVTEKQQQANQKQTELQNATNQLNQAKPKAQQADQAVATTESVWKQAESALQQQQTAAATNPENPALKDAVAQAQTAVDQAKLALEQAQKTAADEKKKLEEAEANLKAAQEAKTQADADLQSAREFQQLAQQEKQRADQLLNQRRNESNPRNINHRVPSNSLTVKIAEFPIELETLADALTINQGEKINVPIKLSRLYDFDGAVSVQPRLPGGVGGISMQSINVAGDQTEGQFEINAQANATVGEHECTVRMQMSFNGQNLIMDRPLKLTVIESPQDQ